MDALTIWVFACISMIYISSKKQGMLNNKKRAVIAFSGIGICIFSFLNIPLGIGNPPYSIGDFSILLSGIGVIIFGIAGYKRLILPTLFPLIAVLGFEGYEIFLRNQDFLIGPLIPPTVALTYELLHLTGLDPLVNGNIITFTSITGETIGLAIVYDCTGIWSLGTFTIAALIVLFTFPETINTKGLAFIAVGYLGTYTSNIGRIFLISLSGYFYGPVGVIEHVHIHIGWILFTLWMIIFWSIYFKYLIGIKSLQLFSKTKEK